MKNELLKDVEEFLEMLDSDIESAKARGIIMVSIKTLYNYQTDLREIVEKHSETK